MLTIWATGKHLNLEEVHLHGSNVFIRPLDFNVLLLERGKILAFRSEAEDSHFRLP